MFHSGNTIGAFRGPWGLRVEIDQSLIMLIGILIYFSLGSSLIYGAVFGAMLIGSIFLHELGHAWGCLIQGVPVRRVVITGGGGFCQHDPTPDRRAQELIVLMGPLVNLALWAFSGVLSWAVWAWAQANPIAMVEHFTVFNQILLFLNLMGWLNLALFVFNMIPVQPMDGGRLFHLFLLRFLPPEQAQRLTGAVGLIMSILWIPAAIWGFVTYGFLLFFIPSIRGHYRMMRGDLSF